MFSKLKKTSQIWKIILSISIFSQKFRWVTKIRIYDEFRINIMDFLNFVEFNFFKISRIDILPKNITKIIYFCQYMVFFRFNVYLLTFIFQEQKYYKNVEIFLKKYLKIRSKLTASHCSRCCSHSRCRSCCCCCCCSDLKFRNIDAVF